jgi:aspartyl-tRNA(Asn)/glutamyl-tRNA(Gln) amidotransferase subunit A
MFWNTIFRYGRQISADDLNEIYGESRANGLGHEVQYSHFSIINIS